MKIAFIGLGVMGRPMAGHLQDAGHELFVVQHRSALPPEIIEKGAVACASAKEAAQAAELIILMLPTTRDVEQVLFADGGVAEGLSPKKCVIDMSSIDPFATRQFADRIGEKDCGYVDAPVSGGQAGAEKASLSIMCGAEESVFERVAPIFKLMGKNITRVGAVGDGQVAKVANQIIVAMNIQGVAEALSFAIKAGADPDKVRGALLGGFASSRVLEVHGERMLRSAFTPGFRVALHQKDLNLALTCGHAIDAHLPGSALALQLFDKVAAAGGENLDHSALFRAY